jgi:hypothetical protein
MSSRVWPGLSSDYEVFSKAEKKIREAEVFMMLHEKSVREREAKRQAYIDSIESEEKS